jgi:hypothetical protein
MPVLTSCRKSWPHWSGDTPSSFTTTRFG